MIDNSGLSGVATAQNFQTITHANPKAGNAFVTVAPNGTGDYYLESSPSGVPNFVFRFDETFTFTGLVFWGYGFGAPNGNEARVFEVEFSTDGGLTFGTAVETVESELGAAVANRAAALEFSQSYSANAVRVSMPDNHFGAPGIGGGDRVGLAELKFLVAVDPSFALLAEEPFQSGGTPVTATIQIGNTGETQNLEISNAIFEGLDSDLFSFVSPTSFPVTIAPGATLDLEITFDPTILTASVGEILATLTFDTNDSFNPNVEIPLSGFSRNPWMVLETPIDFGTLPQGSGTVTVAVQVENRGSSEALEVFGADENVVTLNPLSRFSIDSVVVPAGETRTLNLSFDPSGLFGGTYEGNILLESDDVGATTQQSTVRFTAFLEQDATKGPLVGWWPFDSDASDSTANGNNGAVTGDVTFTELGALAGTGNAATFDGTSKVTVPLSDLLNPESFTVTAFARASVIEPTQFYSIITSRRDIGGNAPGTRGYILYKSSLNDWEFWGGSGGRTTSLWSTTTDRTIDPVLNEWTHFGIRYEASTQTRSLFVNGALVASNVAPIERNLYRDLHIGAGGDEGTAFFLTGQIDDVAIFSEALADEDVLDISNRGIAAYLAGPPLVGSSLVITGLSFDGSSFQIEAIEGLSTGTTYHLETSSDLVTFTAVAGSEFTSVDPIPAVSTTADMLFVRVVEGVIP